MSKDKLNIEELFQNSYNGYKVTPSTNVWNKINKQLQIKEFFKFNASKLNVYYAATVVTAVIILAAIFNINNNLIKNEAQKILKTENINLENKKIYQTSYKITEEKITEEKNIIEKSKQENKEKQINIIPVNKLKVFKPISIIYEDSLKEIDLNTNKQPKVSFSIKCKSGCVPFELDITNNTSNAFEYEWNFGDGKKSKTKNPKHIYRYGGVYEISLTVKGYSGISYSITDSVQVHEKPTAKVFWPYSLPIYTNQKIVVPNKSLNAEEYEWNFGDNTSSKDKYGIHSFSKQGDYLITLKVKSANNCYDSTIVKKVKVVNANYQIKFPNAFSPNPNIASSGYYSKNDKTNDVFYPVTNSVIIDYNLKIFNRFGALIFESNDINIGWNGYYNNKKMSETVFVYIASGKFENQQKFVKKGSITIFYK